jgi:hypothetical protein
MKTAGSRAKIAVVSAAIAGVALSVFVLRRDPPPARVPGKPMAEPATLIAAPPKAPVEGLPAPQAAVQTAGAAAAPPAPRAPVPPPAKLALSFDVPDCVNLALVSVASANTGEAVATVQAGESEPEQVRVGDLLEGGAVTFVGTHPETGVPIVLLEDEAKVACRAARQSPALALKRVGPTSPRDFSARSTDPGDPNRVERMVLKVPPGTSAARADFGAAARQR